MKISIITVCYNSAETIEATIKSIVEQDYDDIEHIIIDGKSTDGTMDIVEKYRAGISALVSEPDDGIYAAMNKGIALATGDVIGFLNADDFFAEKSVVRWVADAFNDKDIDACHGDLVYVAKDNIQKIVRHWKSRPYESGLFEKGWMPAHPTFYVRKRIYEQYGGFDLTFSMANDVELMIRFLAKHKIRSVYIPKIMVKMRKGGISNKNIGNIVRQNLEILRASKKNGVNVSLISFLIYKATSRFTQNFLFGSAK